MRLKKIISAVTTVALAASITVPAFAAETANPTSSTIYIDGQEIAFEAYNINGNNYFKLRDLAWALSSTEKQFNVTWDDAKQVINLISGEEYPKTGALKIGDNIVKSATLNEAPIMVDGEYVDMIAYNINGNNFFKLRDLGTQFGFIVGWNGDDNAVTIDTNGEEEKAPVVQNGDYFYESGMVKTETQIAVVKDNFDNIRLYKNGNGELCVDVSAVSLPKELANAGWKISLAVLPLEKGSGLPMDANGDFMLSSGQTASKVITIGSAMHGTEEAIKVSDFNNVMITMSLYHKDHTKSDSAMRFKSVSDNTSVITGVYVNGSQNMKNENINMNLSSVYSGIK